MKKIVAAMLVALIAPLISAQDLKRLDAVEPLEQAVADADLVLFAMPVGQMPDVMAAMRPHLGAKPW